GGLLGHAHPDPAPRVRPRVPPALPRGRRRVHRRGGLPRGRVRGGRGEACVNGAAGTSSGTTGADAAAAAAVRGAISGALVGALVWLGLVAAGLAGALEIGTIECLLALAPLVIVPLALEARWRLVADEAAPAFVPWSEGIARLITVPGALFAAASFAMTPG